MNNKKQHYIPATYLKAWCDISSPENYKPYVWVFPRNGGEPKKKPPKKIFWEPDFYTIKPIIGERNLSLEQGLSQIESKFALLRDKKLFKQKPLNDQDISILCIFTAVMFARTKSRRNHHQEQWQKVLDLATTMEDWVKNSTPDQVKQLSSSLGPHSETGTSMSIEDIKFIKTNLVQSFMKTEIETIAPALAEMQFTIIDTLGIPTFITSDNPCVWFDPDLSKNPTPFGAGGLISPNMELSLPLSPTQTVFFGKKLITSNRYIPIQTTNPLVDTLNSRVYAYSNEYFVSSKKKVPFSWHLQVENKL